MAGDSQKLKQLGEQIAQLLERGQSPSLKALAAVDLKSLKRMGEQIAQALKRGQSPTSKALANIGPTSPAFDPRKKAEFEADWYRQLFERLDLEYPPLPKSVVKKLLADDLRPRKNPPKTAQPNAPSAPTDYFSIKELAERWRCSRGTVYNRLRAFAVEVLDFAPRGKRSRKAVSRKNVLEIEKHRSKRLH
jgi:hypothetical protein